MTLLILTLIPPCGWDRDTLRFEAQGLPGIIEVASGYFEQYPKLYYQMRLERVQNLLQKGVMQADDFDDAGVALDRLGRPGEAITMMEAKHVFLEKHNDKDSDAHYRYYANVGTFYAHHWLASGKDFSNMSDMQRAREAIAKAIEINPEAHFGREIYQLKFLEYILSIPTEKRNMTRYWNFSIPIENLVDKQKYSDFFKNPSLRNPEDESLDKAIEGLNGLVVLGSAWQSLDVFWTLRHLLTIRGDWALAYFVSLRCLELVASGKQFLNPAAPKGDALTDAIWETMDPNRFYLEEEPMQTIKPYYQSLIKHAALQKRSWMKFVIGSLNRGWHPDTHPEFWKDIPKINLLQSPN